MSSSANRFRHESLQDCQSIINYLIALKDGFESGALLFSTDGRNLVLKPDGLINLNVEAKRKGEEIKLSLKMRWSENEGGGNPEDQPLLIEPIKAG